MALIKIGKMGQLAFFAIRKKPLFHLQSLIPVGPRRDTSPAGNISKAPPPFKWFCILLSSCFLLIPDKLSTGSKRECIALTDINMRFATTFKSCLTVESTLISAKASSEPIGWLATITSLPSLGICSICLGL